MKAGRLAIVAFALVSALMGVAGVSEHDRWAHVTEDYRHRVFLSMQNRDHLSYSNNQFGLDLLHPTNIELVFAYEPVVTRAPDGCWVVHFKDAR